MLASNVAFSVLQTVQSSEDVKEVEKLRKVSLFCCYISIIYYNSYYIIFDYNIL